MAEQIRLPTSSLAELKKIIQGYARLKENIDLNGLARVVGIGRTTISPNNPALTELGLIEGTKRKNVTPLGKKLGRALALDQESDVKNCLREIVVGNQFLSDVISTVRIQGGMTIDDLGTHILYSSGQSINKKSGTGSRAYADLLIESGLLVESDGRVTVAQSTSPDQQVPSEVIERDKQIGKDLTSQAAGHPKDKPEIPLVHQVIGKSEPVEISINIQLQIPPTENPEVYNNLFRALREHLIQQPNDSDA